jgi:hypothetical protein
MVGIMLVSRFPMVPRWVPGGIPLVPLGIPLVSRWYHGSRWTPFVSCVYPVSIPLVSCWYPVGMWVVVSMLPVVVKHAQLEEHTAVSAAWQPSITCPANTPSRTPATRDGHCGSIAWILVG